MSEHYDCEETRAHYHQVRRGDVTPDEMARYDDHLRSCEACQAFVLRMDGMLDSATEVDVAQEVGIDRDDLFAKIMADVADDSADADGTSVPALREVEEHDEEEFEIPRSPRRWVAIAMLAAALVVAGLGVALWMEQAPDSPLETEVATEDSTDSSAGVAATDSTEGADETEAKAPVFVAMERIRTPDESVRVFSAKRSNVEITTDDDETSLKVDEGTVLIEFTPDDPRREKLSVRAGDLTVRVVGTVFYVHRSAAGSVVGVVTGKVEVTSADGKSLFLTDGQEYDQKNGIRTADEETRTAAETYVDIEAHEAKITARLAPIRRAEGESSGGRDDAKPPRNAEATGSSDGSGTSGKPGKEMSVLAQTLRDQASEAVRLRQYSDAAQLLEELIVELPSDHPAAMSARLDLARIYMKHLKAPRRAVPHLKRFIVDRPNDPATPSARTTLCRILEAEEETDAACEGN